MNAICKAPGCARSTYSKGYCGMHYQRAWKHGDPMIGGRVQQAAICKVVGCVRPSVAHSLCEMHRCRLLRTGVAGEASPRKKSGPVIGISHPVGTVIVKPVKMRNRTVDHKFIKLPNNKWVRLAAYVLTKSGSPVNRGDYIIFRDGNTMNCSLGNLFIRRRYLLLVCNRTACNSPIVCNPSRPKKFCCAECARLFQKGY